MISLLVLMILLSQSIKAIPSDSLRQQFPIRITTFDHTISLPLWKVAFFDFNPAASIGTEYVLQKKAKHDWHITGNLGFYHHKNWQSATFLNSEIGYRQHLGRFQATARIGLGYAHVVRPNHRTYELKTDGTYEENNSADPSLMPSVALSVGYQLQDSANSPELFLTFMTALDMPINIFSGIHQFIGAGVQFYPFQR